jgi:hypothetical protein
MSKELFIESFLLIGLGAIGTYDGAKLLKEPLIIREYIGPGWYLIFLSSMLIICGIIYLLVNAKHRAIAGRKRFSLHVGPHGYVLILLGLYTIGVSFVGYIPSTLFFFVLAYRIFGVSSWIRSIIIGLISIAVFQLIFSYLLGIPLP